MKWDTSMLYRVKILTPHCTAPGVQQIADRISDSLYFPLYNKLLTANTIIFADLEFRIEVAKILNPDAKRVSPDASLACIGERNQYRI